MDSHRAGFSVGNIFVNHQLLADDLCVFGHSLSGVQRLLKFFWDHAAEHELLRQSFVNFTLPRFARIPALEA